MKNYLENKTSVKGQIIPDELCIEDLKIGDRFCFKVNPERLYIHGGHVENGCYFYHAITIKEFCPRKVGVFKVIIKND